LTYALTGGTFGFNGLLANARLPFELPFGIALPVSAILAGFASVLLERVAFRPLRARDYDPLLTLVSSLGAAVVLVNALQYLFGAEIYTFPDSIFGGLPAAIDFGTSDRPMAIRTTQIVIFGVCSMMVALLTYWVNFTRVGKALQAVAEDTVTASLLGIDPEKYIVITFWIGGALAGLAGTLVGASVGIAGPYFGIAFGLKGLGVIVLGGLGSIPGAVIGGLLLGIAEALVPAEYSGYREAIAFAILFLTLLVRPRGLLGRRSLEKV
jgi:branched-chain amino acid transport system permease protein